MLFSLILALQLFGRWLAVTVSKPHLISGVIDQSHVDCVVCLGAADISSGKVTRNVSGQSLADRVLCFVSADLWVVDGMRNHNMSFNHLCPVGVNSCLVEPCILDRFSTVPCRLLYPFLPVIIFLFF